MHPENQEQSPQTMMRFKKQGAEIPCSFRNRSMDVFLNFTGLLEILAPDMR